MSSQIAMPCVETIPEPLNCASGWPWDVPKRDIRLDDGVNLSDLPRITIVTPSFNQGNFLERTIRSVLMQGYPKLEYLIMDGGSSDHSLDIIKHYSSALTRWKSAPDDGQSAAIEEGFVGATGDLLAWINSDDYYLPDTLYKIARIWIERGRPDWIVGASRFVDDQGLEVQVWVPDAPRTLGHALSMGAGTPQPSGFWSKSLWEHVVGLDARLHYSMDEDLWMRFHIAGASPVVTEDVLAVRHLQSQSKTVLDLSRFSTEFSQAVIRHSVHLPDSQRSVWIQGCRSMAEYYGIDAWRELSRGHWSSGLRFLRSGVRLSPIGGFGGLFRGAGAAGKRWLRARFDRHVGT